VGDVVITVQSVQGLRPDKLQLVLTPKSADEEAVVQELHDA
jgi:hypothetical protein